MPIQVAVIGFGTVGTGVVRTLLEKRNWIRKWVGQPVNLKWVCDRDVPRPSGFKLPVGIATTDMAKVLNDPEVQIVVELIGGLEPAKSILLEAIRKKKHVVTANKALLAESGRQLFAAAAKADVDLSFEASVGGGIPIIKILREGLVVNEFDAILGIINGTSNYILTQMREKNLSFYEALSQAKRLGYAERNPALDINGNDAAHKLAILTLLGFNVFPRQSDIYVEGITRISQADIQYADELGYSIKPLAIAKETNHELEVRVHPALLAKSHPLANVNGVYNAVYVHGDLVGSQLYYGRGAGQNPTASAVVSDIVSVACDLAGVGGVPPIARALSKHQRVRFRRIGDIETRYYIRFTVKDQPGVLAKIASVLGRHHISIATVHQKERTGARAVHVVMMSHMAKESNLRNALRILDQADFTKQPTVAIRTEEPRQR